MKGMSLMQKTTIKRLIRHIICFFITLNLIVSNSYIYSSQISDINTSDISDTDLYDNTVDETENESSVYNEITQNTSITSIDDYNYVSTEDAPSEEHETSEEQMISENQNIFSNSEDFVENDTNAIIDKSETDADDFENIIEEDCESSIDTIEGEEDNSFEEALDDAEPLQYTIIYILNGGTNNINNPDFILLDYKLVLKKPVREGYVFAGWFNSDDNTPVTTIKNINAKIYAKWTPIKYKVTLNLNGGKLSSENSATITYTNLSPRIDLPLPSQKYYTFDGWYKDKNFTQKIDYIYSGSIGNMNLYAKWNHIYHSITYYMNDTATDPAILSSKHATRFSEKNGVTLTTPKRTGFTFKGYYKKSPTSITFSSKDKAVTSIPQYTTSDKVLYAWWTENSYKLSFNANGGSFVNKIPSGTYKYTDSIKMPFNTAVNSRIGYKFMGWNTQKDGTGTHYDAGTIVSRISSKNNSSITLYVQWEPIQYGVYCDYREGSMFDANGNPLNPRYHTVVKTITLKEPTKKGYIFGGWYDNPQCIGKKYKKIANKPCEFNFYALWTPIKYKIAFNPNGAKGDIMKNLSCKYDVEYVIPECTYTKKGYVFKEWNTMATGDGISYMPGETISNLTGKNSKTITLYPIWTK